jgi:hypothetical protein
MSQMSLIPGRKITKVERPTESCQSHSPEVLALRDRVKRGNDKLFQAWRQIRELADKDEWSRQMDRWNEAQQKLHQLCQELKLKGYNDCLYLQDGRRARTCLNNPDGFWCQVCPSIYAYWETELMELPSPKAPKPELAAELVALRTRKLLDSRGWCLWKCSVFGGEVIVIIRDERVEGYPKGHPVYTEAELERLMQGDVKDSTLHLVHEAKKMGGAVIMSIEKEGHDGKV